MDMKARARNTTCNYKYSLFWKIRDVLPFTLKLPYAISTAKTEAQLEELAQLGLSKWGPLPWSLLNWIYGTESVLGWYNVTSKNNPHLQCKTLGLWGPWIASFENLFLSQTLNQFSEAGAEFSWITFASPQRLWVWTTQNVQVQM